MGRRVRPIRAWKLPETAPAPQGNAAVVDAVLEQHLVRSLGALPLLLPILEQLGLREVVNQHCQLAESGADLDVGLVALLLVGNRLVAPQPLVHVEEWLGQTALPELLGFDAGQANDDRLARTLDALVPHLDVLWQELILRAIVAFDLDLSQLCYDLTSISFFETYEEAELITYGYSRDHRPDCKQLEVASTVTAAGGVPIDYHLLAGNIADCTTPVANLRRLQHLLALLPARPAGWPLSLAISDRAMLTLESIALRTRRAGCVTWDRWTRAWATGRCGTCWPASRPRNLPRPRWATDRSGPKTIPTGRPTRASHATCCCAIPTPPALDGPRHGGLESGQGPPGCRAAHHPPRPAGGGASGSRREDGPPSLHDEGHGGAATGGHPRSPARSPVVTVRVEEHAASVPPETTPTLRLVWTHDAAALAQASALDGRYVLGTNDPNLDPEAMLASAKQHDVPEKRFALVKGPLAVRPVYLHKQERLQALVFCTMVALLVFALLELLAHRAGFAASGHALLTQFASLAVLILVLHDGSILRRVTGLAPPLAAILHALGFPPADRYAIRQD